ncbi:MAG: glycosyltransferase [Cyanobacteriota bacterium]|nr:glycosyltransferase [Cyanobacteriota bacterium]
MADAQGQSMHGVMGRSLPTYSVLMPLAPWEAAAVLEQALASLEAQTLPPAQVVVSCDGPPPAPLRTPLENATLPLQIVVGPGAEGVGPVLARGLLQCRQELVVRADADDLSLPERCAMQVGWMARHPAVLVLGCPIEEFRASAERPVSRRLVPLDPGEIGRVALVRNPLNHPAVILRREAVLAVGNYRARPGFEDYDLWLRLLAVHGSGALANLPEVLVRARVGDAHLARRHGWRYAQAELRFFLSCGRERLLPWHRVIAALAARLPLRLLPAGLLARVMGRVTRTPS